MKGSRRTMIPHKYLIIYGVVLHLALALVLIKSDFLQRVNSHLGGLPPELSKHYYSMLGYQSRMDGQVPDGAVVFIGDSLTQSLAVSNISPNAFNYGIGSDTTLGVLQRLEVYRSLARAETVVLAIGVNDLKRRDPDAIIENYQSILQRLPKQAAVVISALHPVDEKMRSSLQTNRRIQQVNQGLRKLADASATRAYCDITPQLAGADGNLKPAYHVGDGIHLSAAGYALWTAGLKAAIETLRRNRKAGAE